MERKQIFKALLCFSLVFLPFLSWAANGKLSGVVKDAETGEPLIGANVIIEGGWRQNKVIALDVPI